MKKKKAFITGVNGQDGSYLTELLLKKKYEVHGLIRRTCTFNRNNIEHVIKKHKGKDFFLHYGDLTDSSNLNRLVEKIQPQEIYNLAAQSHVKVSFEVPEYTAETDAIGTLRLLDAIRETGVKCRFYQASTSELFGKAQEVPQSESTPFYPRSPYGVAKLYAFWIVKNYREAYNLFACNGILFNHESPRRGENFVTRKITMSAVKVIKGLQKKVSLGNLDAKRDWGFAGDYVEAMWKMLQMKKPDDYVIATGNTNTVREFVEMTFKCLGVDIRWKGKGVNEKGYNKKSGKLLVDVNPHYFRPSEVDLLIGDASKAHNELKWRPKVQLDKLIKMMVEEDLKKF